MGVVLLAATFLLLWVLIILPQQRRVRAHRELVSTVAVGDEVMTSAGLFGTVRELADDTAEIEVAPGIVLRFARQAIVRKVGGGDTDASDADDETTG
jgi:preprotein translocase subunit YajC